MSHTARHGIQFYILPQSIHLTVVLDTSSLQSSKQTAGCGQFIISVHHVKASYLVHYGLRKIMSNHLKSLKRIIPCHPPSSCHISNDAEKHTRTIGPSTANLNCWVEGGGGAKEQSGCEVIQSKYSISGCSTLKKNNKSSPHAMLRHIQCNIKSSRKTGRTFLPRNHLAKAHCRPQCQVPRRTADAGCGRQWSPRQPPKVLYSNSSPVHP